MIWWPFPPPDDAEFLVRATGDWVEKVRRCLDSAAVHYTMGGHRRDDVKFYVLKEDAEAARLAVNNL